MLFGDQLTFDDDLETVFMLTDGKPTIGVTGQPAKILEDILGRNRFRINYNTIGIAVNPATEAFLKQLAVGSGGEYRRVLNRPHTEHRKSHLGLAPR